MSKKLKLALIAAAILVLGALAAYLLIFKNKDTTAAQQQSMSENQLEKQLACEIFTIEKAREILGSGAVKSANSSEPSASYSEDIATSRCSYTDQQYDETASLESKKLASLTLRSPRNDTGRAANQAVFVKETLPNGAVMVERYGDGAFWNPEYGQLNILKAGEWYVLDYGSFLPQTRGQGDTEKFADILADRL